MEPDLEPAIAEMSRPVTARAALSISGTPTQPSQKIRFVANRHCYRDAWGLTRQ
jgi:hypothetical protein